MDFKEYQEKAKQTAIYKDQGENYIYPSLGLAGETGEVMEKIKKLIRDKDGIIDDEFKKEITKELGNILWYLAQLSTEFNISFQDVAEKNIEKLFSRKDRGMLHGDGDNR